MPITVGIAVFTAPVGLIEVEEYEDLETVRDIVADETVIPTLELELPSLSLALPKEELAGNEDREEEDASVLDAPIVLIEVVSVTAEGLVRLDSTTLPVAPIPAPASAPPPVVLLAVLLDKFGIVEIVLAD